MDKKQKGKGEKWNLRKWVSFDSSDPHTEAKKIETTGRPHQLQNNKPQGKTKGNIKTPLDFSTAYLGYLSNRYKINIYGEDKLPPLFTLSNICRWSVISKELSTEYPYPFDIEILKKGTSDTLNTLSEKFKATLDNLNDKAKMIFLVALHDLTDAYIEENTVLRENEKGQKELTASIEAVNNLLSLPILNPVERTTLEGIKATLDNLRNPVEYTFVWHLQLSTMRTWPEGRGQIDTDAHDEYMVKHKNLTITKVYKFFKQSLQIVIYFLLTGEGNQRREAAKYITADILNDYLLSYQSGKFQSLADFTFKTVENAASRKSIPSL